MKIIYFLIPSLAGGGAERVVLDIVNGFNELSKDIHCQIIAINDEPDVYSGGPEIVSLGLHKPEINHFYYLKMIIYYLHATYRYHKLLCGNNITTSISSVFETPIVNYLACLGTTTKSIQVRHSTMSRLWELSKTRGINKIFNQFLIQFVYNKSEQVISVSNGVRDDLISCGVRSDKLITIYNPLNIDKITIDCRKLVNHPAFSSTLPLIITAGRLSKEKGQWHLLRIFREIVNEMPCKLVICGEGNLRPYLEKIASDLGILNDVVFMGWVDNPYKYFSKSTIFVLPSLTEGLPTVLLEAMACGCPVVSTDCKFGPREILDKGKYGLLTEPLDDNYHEECNTLTIAEDDMKEKILLLLKNKDLRDNYSKLGFQRAQDFRRDIAIQKYTDLINDVTHNLKI